MRRYLLLAAAALAAFTAYQFVRASRAESAARLAVKSESEIPYTQQSLSDPPPAGWETLATPADFRDAAIWNGQLYVAGANALFRYGADGALLQTWRAGMELPPAPLNALAASEELWIATEGEGALSFDGSRFRRILPTPPGARKLRAILPLSTGSVLLGTATLGVLRFDGTHLRPFHPSLNGLPITALAGVEEDLWAGTRDAGVVHLRAGHAERFSEPEGLPDKAVHAIATRAADAWIGTSTGIAHFQDGKLQRTLAAGLLAKSIAARDSEIIVGTLADGWLRIPTGGRLAQRRIQDLGNQGGEVRRVFFEGDDLYLLRPATLDLLRAGRLSNALTSQPALLSHGNITALEMDPAGRLWVGYFDHGLDIFDAVHRKITPVENERIFCVNRISRSNNGQDMAVATANGLVFFDAAGHERQVLTRADGLIATHVTDVVPHGNGWVAATPAGLTFIDGGTRSVYAFHGLVNNHVYTVANHADTLLAGTLGGLSVLQNERVKASFTTANSALKINWITALARAGDDWFAGTYGGGVQRLDPSGVWHTFDSMPPNAVVNPNAIAVAPGAVFAGTLEHGLLAWDRQRPSWRSIRSGLPSSNVTAILYHEKKLYLGTDNGLVVVSTSDLGL
jgi:ligand-binding sensor domain-containing protein